MGIGIEYIQRRKVAQQVATFPCSLFLTNLVTGGRLVIYLDQSPKGHIVRRWKLFDCESNQGLPAMQESISPNAFEDSTLVPSEYSLMRFHHKSIPARENQTSRPITSEKYSEYFDKYLGDFSLHHIFRERWLWNAFLEVYNRDLIVYGMFIKRSINLYGDYGDKEVTQDQMTILEKNYPKTWKYWLMWRRYMLDFKGIPGELSFGGIFRQF